ncbi:MAG: D-glycero-alpha-D-manno-heptose-1,7-bisphosphate 7-phosphatase [Gemmatimonadota bacterium]
MSYSAAFLDRDGTIIRDSGYPADPLSVELLPGAAAAIARLNAERIPVIVVTNQSGIGRGLYGIDDFRTVQREVERRLAEEGARVDAVYLCAHDPEGEVCDCRKPGLGLFRRAAARRGIRLADALFIGDRVKDVLPAVELGATAFLLRSGRAGPEPPPGCIPAADLGEAVARALGGGAGGSA